MKKIITIIALSVTFFSCSKESVKPGDPQSSTGSISYKVNGQIMSMDGTNIASGEGVVFAKQLKGSLVPATRYLLNAQKGVNNAFILTIVTDSLQNTSYHYDSTIINNNAVSYTFGTIFNGQFSFLLFSSDVFNVNITSYSNGRISGTFSGKFTSSKSAGSIPDYNLRGSVIITEGKLNNVLVTY